MDWPELVLDVLLAALAVAMLSFGGEEFASEYNPQSRWIVGGNPFKRSLYGQQKQKRGH